MAGGLQINSVGGIALIPVKSASQLEKETQQRVTEQQQNPVIQGLATHVHKRWESAKRAKLQVEQRLLDCIRRRRGEYGPDKLDEIRRHGGSEIFMGISSVKCRAAGAWLRDTLLGTGADRPWELDTTPLPELPPDVIATIREQLIQKVQQLEATFGQQVDPETLREWVMDAKDQALREAQEDATKRVERMESKMEDQMLEGGWVDAFSQFIDDLVTFPTAILKGPVLRKRTVMQWADNGLVPTEVLRLEWDRVDPFMFYPAAWASGVEDGPVIERHKLSREDLEALIGVEGYNTDAINMVLADFDTGGLREWLYIDGAKAIAEGKLYTMTTQQTTDLVDALQLWDSIPGKLLIEWGMSEKDVTDPFKSYPCEVWLIGNIVIRAVLNYDPLGRKPYYATSYEKIPGVFWGNGVIDLVRDPQDMCNAAARSLSNNMGIASGPQVWVNTERMPAGESITSMYPWKIWQGVSPDYADNSDPIRFFQPNSNADVLMAVFEKFSSLADEYSGIPRYMSGEHTPGVGRTSSGLSMLINNASKALKQVVNNIDQDVINNALTRLYQHNLRYSQDEDLIGDVNIVAKGAMSLVSREAAAVRRNEFLQLVLNSPLAQQIVGLPGAAELLRENARLLDVNPDKIVPSREMLQQQQAQQAVQQAMMSALQQSGQMPMQPGQPPAPQPAMVRGAPVLPDGSRVGGRDSNFVSPRPNMS